MKRILVIFAALLLYWSSAAQNIESISLRINQVVDMKTNELSGGDGSYISYSNGSAEVGFYPGTKIINQTSLDRNYFERECSVSDFRIDRKGRYRFRINIEDNHNTRDFYIDIVVDLELRVHNGTVYYYGKPQSRIHGPITYLKIEGESKTRIPQGFEPKHTKYNASFDGGGSDAFQNWVVKHQRYPRKAKKQGKPVVLQVNPVVNISGIPVFNISRFANEGNEVHIDFVNDTDSEDLFNDLNVLLSTNNLTTYFTTV